MKYENIHNSDYFTELLYSELDDLNSIRDFF